MIVLRYLYVLALAAWVGGMLALAGVAGPSIFSALDQTDSGGRVLASAMFGEMLRKFQMAASFCGVIMLVTLAGMRLLGPKPMHFTARFATVAGMVAIAVYSGISISNQIERRSTTLMVVNMIGGLSL